MLDEQLLQLFKEESVNVVLAIPEVYDDSEGSTIIFRGAGRSNLIFNSVYIGGYREYVLSKHLSL